MHNPDIVMFLGALLFAGAFLIAAVLGFFFLLDGRIAGILRNYFRPSDKQCTNASLTCEHGHEVRVYIHVPTMSISKRFDPRDNKFWVDPKRCPVCGGQWRMPEKHHGD